MNPASPVARRFSMLGCLSVGVAALALSGCGGGAAATSEQAAASPSRQQESELSAGGSCQGQLGAFLKSMGALRNDLAVGLSYEQYVEELGGVRGAYAKLPVDRMTIECLSTAGAAGEKALNQYTAAANSWGECLADTSCDTASIEPVLQRKWRRASSFLSAAQKEPRS